MSFLCSSVFLLLKVLGAILPPAAFTRGAAAVSVTQPEGSAFYMKKFSVYEGICHFFPGFIVYHLYGGARDGHSLRAFLLIASKQINQPDTFIFINGHADAFFFAAAVVYGSKVEDFGMQQIFRSLVGRGITSPRISGLCNWHMLFTSSLYINEKRCQ